MRPDTDGHCKRQNDRLARRRPDLQEAFQLQAGHRRVQVFSSACGPAGNALSSGVPMFMAAGSAGSENVDRQRDSSRSSSRSPARESCSATDRDQAGAVRIAAKLHRKIEDINTRSVSDIAWMHVCCAQRQRAARLIRLRDLMRHRFEIDG